jgi:polyhydroxybutyrate depolymerase
MMLKRIAMAAMVLCGFWNVAQAADGLQKREWTVDGVAREALVYAPESAKTTAAPLVFVFHGHGCNMQNTSNTFAIHKNWPEAIVVYPQGLNTVSHVDPEGKKPGWAVTPDKNKDLKFFDAMLESVKKDYRVDEKRTFVTGHSNGALFTYLLWSVRGDTFAAFAPISAPCAQPLTTLKPKPVFHVAGEKDTIAPFEMQKKTIEGVRKVNNCDPTGETWAANATLYPSKGGTPVIAYIHPGGHAIPREVPPLIVKFFKDPTGKTRPGDAG